MKGVHSSENENSKGNTHEAALEAVSKCVQTRDDLNQRNYLMEHVIQSISVPVFMLDLEGKFIMANHAALTIGGWSEEDVFCAHYTEALSEASQNRMRGFFEQSAKNGVSIFDQETEIKVKSGERRRVTFSLSPVRVDGATVAVTGTVADVTDLRELENTLRESTERYRELSIRDHLTGLYNLRHFFEVLEAETARSQRYGRPLSLIFMDIDDFKNFNDTYGHVEGDKVLKALGRVITETLRTSDLAFRYGGEEFAALLPETDADHAAVTAERLRTAFVEEEFAPAEGEKVHKSLSLGVSAHRPGEQATDFVARADENMYRAKRTGKNKYLTDADA